MPCATQLLINIPKTGPGREAALAALDSGLAGLASEAFVEVRVDHDPFPSLCALSNGPLAWLMFVRYSGDAGFSSRNPAYAGPPDATVEYCLSNGQLDQYPAAWAYSRDSAFRVIRCFAERRLVPAHISWANESGDGAASPNDPFTAPE